MILSILKDSFVLCFKKLKGHKNSLEDSKKKRDRNLNNILKGSLYEAK